jgi:hypothetical protein
LYQKFPSYVILNVSLNVTSSYTYDVWARDFSLSQNVKTKSSVHSASCMAGVEGSVYRGKVAGM